MRKEFDVIVAGGGAAGVAAALAATRNGAKTLLIERDGYLGGTVTHCSLPTFCPFADPEKPIVRGIGMEILNRLKSEMELVSFYDDRPEKPMYNWFPIDGEALKRVLDEIILESGCELLLHTDLIGCETKDGAITGLTCQTPGGRLTLSGKTYIDCTGNAALAAMAGCETRIGDENGEVQSATLCFTIANFDTERFVQYFRETGEGGNLENACRRALMDHAFPEGERLVSGFSFPAPGIAVWNFGHVFNIDPLDAVSLTQAEIAGRKQIGELLRFLRTYVPGAEKATLVSSGPVIGIRESRRVVGRYTLTREDYLRRANFDDAIASYCYPIDIHAGRKQDLAEQNDQFRQLQYRPGEFYGIPYRCLTPIGINNLLAAGKIISCDRAMLASVRVVPCCFATGQAAGTAAALAAKESHPVAGVDVDGLRAILIKQDCEIR